METLNFQVEFQAFSYLSYCLIRSLIFTGSRLRHYLSLSCLDLVAHPGWPWPSMCHVLLEIAEDRPVA